VHFLDEPLRWAHRELGSNGIVFLAVSGYGGFRGHLVPFLNSEIVFSSAPARLSLSTRAPVVPVVDLVDREGIHRVHLLDPLDPPISQKDEASFTLRLVRGFEALARQHLAQLDWIWYVLRCQEQRGEVAAYEEGKVVRATRRPS
jgi:lauroyl/myristoyl acyltransferase